MVEGLRVREPNGGDYSHSCDNNWLWGAVHHTSIPNCFRIGCAKGRTGGRVAFRSSSVPTLFVGGVNVCVIACESKVNGRSPSPVSIQGGWKWPCHRGLHSGATSQ